LPRPGAPRRGLAMPEGWVRARLPAPGSLFPVPCSLLPAPQKEKAPPRTAKLRFPSGRRDLTRPAPSGRSRRRRLGERARTKSARSSTRDKKAPRRISRSLNESGRRDLNPRPLNPMRHNDLRDFYNLLYPRAVLGIGVVVQGALRALCRKKLTPQLTTLPPGFSMTPNRHRRTPRDHPSKQSSSH